MKLLFFHISHGQLIEEFLPRGHSNGYNFFWVDDRYHDFTSLEYPEKHIHFFVRDPWAEGYDFMFMQGIGNSEEKLRNYYGRGFGIGAAPILRIATPLKPDLMASYDENERVYKIVGSDQSFRVLDDENNLIPFVESEALRAELPDLENTFPVIFLREDVSD